jgi:predicted enzyme related to lactoylglutathione lyase
MSVPRVPLANRERAPSGVRDTRPASTNVGRSSIGAAMLGSGMSLRLVALCVDANDPLGLARFWAEALRWEVADETAEEIRLVPTDGTRFRMDFMPVSEPKVGPNRLHLDLTSTSLDDQRDSVARLVELGARHIDIGQRPDEGHVVLADPEGNEFCVIEPGNSFLADCGRLGSITCDGTREVGYFWSAALGWPLVWDQDQETAIRAPDGTGPLITWGGGPLAPKLGKNRLHLEVAPLDQAEEHAEVDRLVAMGATRVDIGQGEVDWVVMADPDSNEFCVLRPA